MSLLSAYQPAPGDTAETLLRVSTAARFRPEGETGWWDLGDVITTEPQGDVQRRPVMRATRYGLQIAHEQVLSASFTWTLELQEHVATTLEVLFFAATEADAEQPAMEGELVAIANVQRRQIYELGAWDVRSAVVRVGTEVFTAGRDYELDPLCGEITIPEQSTIPPGSTVTVTFNAGVARFNRHTAVSSKQPLTRKGTLRLLEFDGHDRLPQTVRTFACSLSPDRWGQRSTASFISYTLRATQLGEADCRTRAITEPTLIKAGETLTWGSPLRRIGTLRSEQGSILRIR